MNDIVHQTPAGYDDILKPTYIERRPRLAAVPTLRPQQQWKGVINPLGAIEPPHVGTFFFDKQNGVFYRADGPTAFDWHLITPAEFHAGFVQSFVDFCAPAHNAMSKDELLDALKLSEPAEARAPYELDARQIAEMGLRVNDQRCWQAGDVRILMARIKLEAPPPVALFVGFRLAVVDPTKPPFVAAMDQLSNYDPSAVGIGYDDHAGDVVFGLSGGAVMDQRFLKVRNEHVAVRVEIDGAQRFGVFVDDSLLAEGRSIAPAEALVPRVTFFLYGRRA